MNVLRPGRLSRNLDREMEFHLGERTDALIAAGVLALTALGAALLTRRPRRGRGTCDSSSPRRSRRLVDLRRSLAG